MPAKYICRYEVTKKRFLWWCFEDDHPVVRSFIWIFLIVISGKRFMTTGYPAFGVICAYCAYRVILRWLVSGMRVYHKEKKAFEGEWMRKVAFRENIITVIDGDSCVRIEYRDVKKFKEEDDLIRIILKGGKTLRIYKSGFDSWNSGFISFIDRKCKENKNNGQSE